MASPSTSNSFKINISDDELQSLKQKVALTRLPDELDDADWAYGSPLADIRRLLAHWKGDYDWRKHERQLNEDLPQFKTNIEVDGFGELNIQFVHKKSEVDGAIPLLFVHGWPGGFFEVQKILPLLTQAPSDSEPSFHVVAISLPRFGFSEAPKKKGFSISQYAEMLSLGYKEYVTQGGDWGYAIIARIASLYGGKHNKAWHTNFQDMAPGMPPTLFRSPIVYLRHALSKYTPIEKAALEHTVKLKRDGMGYCREQETQPQTLGYGLADSPVGLLAWIYEKLVNWTDGYLWTDDEILTWISLYWFSTAGPAASLRIYYERNNAHVKVKLARIPQGISYFPKELTSLPRLWIRSRYLVFESEHEHGGHFAAHEKPEDLVSDLRKMFGKGGPAYGVVENCLGYWFDIGVWVL